MTKYEELIKHIKNKDTSVDAIAKKYKMSVMDVKIMQEWKEKYKKEHKLRQEAEGETNIVKAIGQNSPEMKAAKQKIKELQDSLDRFKKENNECYNRIADLNETLKSKDYFEKPDYKFLVNENHRLEQQYLEVMADNKKLHKEVRELKEDNKKLAQEIDDRIARARKAGM